MSDLYTAEDTETRLSERHYRLDAAPSGLAVSDTLSGAFVDVAPGTLTLPRRVIQLAVSAHNISPLEAAVARVYELLRLPANWDTYGAPRVSPEIAELGLKLIASLIDQGVPLPSIVPTSSGGLQLEWHSSEVDFELELQSVFSIWFFFQSAQGESMEGVLGTDVSVLAYYLSRLTS